MGRIIRVNVGGLVYHVLNRAGARQRVFDGPGDYAAFERLLEEAVPRVEMRLVAYSVMPDHWHLVLWPRKDGDLSTFVGWLTLTHTQRWHARRHDSGEGHVYQGRFKSFVVEADEHLWAVVRYVERNPLRAGLASRPEAWRWSSAWRLRSGDAKQRRLLDAGPLPRPHHWPQVLNQPQSEVELQAIRHAVRRGCPYGADGWVERIVERFGLQATVRPRGRPPRR